MSNIDIVRSFYDRTWTGRHWLAGMQELLGAADATITTHFFADAPDNQVIVHATLHVVDKSYPYLELWQLRDGKVRRIEPFLDTALLRQLARP